MTSRNPLRIAGVRERIIAQTKTWMGVMFNEPHRMNHSEFLFFLKTNEGWQDIIRALYWPTADMIEQYLKVQTGPLPPPDLAKIFADVEEQLYGRRTLDRFFLQNIPSRRSRRVWAGW